MFRGADPDLVDVLRRARAAARELGHPRTGSEHLLLALRAANHPVGAILTSHGVTASAVRAAADRAGALGAGVAADRDTLAPLGLDVERLLSRLDPAVMDRPTGREPLLPLGGARSRRRCARMTPPIGLDAQAAYEASLRLALARRDRAHRPEHLALCLVALDPGVAWVLRTAGVDASGLLAGLAKAFPPPGRNALLRAERRIGRDRRRRDLVNRYQRTTGRTVSSARAVLTLITG